MILTYILKSSLCLAVLFGFYKVVLEGKAMHQFKRYYLLASLVFAFTIPLTTITYTVDTLPEPEPVVNAYEYYSNPIITEEPIAVAPEFPIPPVILWSIYGLGVLIFGVRFVLNLTRLKRKISASQQIKESHYTLSLVKQSIIPHSFLQWIFLNKTAYQNQEIAPAVLAHEATHVRQKHSLDILFIEFLQVVFWFNPFIWLSKKSIKLNHEFLADQGVLLNDSNIAIYQNILLSYASSTNHTALESPFNYSLTKKRILMLSQTFSRKRAAISVLLLIPIVVLCLFFFNNEIKAQPKLLEDTTITIRHLSARNVNVTIVAENAFTINGKSATKGTFAKTLASFNQDLTKEERNRVMNFHIHSDRTITPMDLRFLQKVASDYGYHRILANEKEEIVRVKNNHPAYNHPTSQDLKEWQKNKYIVFLDDQKIENNALKDYHPDDLPYYYSTEKANSLTEVRIWTNPFWQEKNNIGFGAVSNQTENYASQFIKGALKNGKTPLVIEVKNDLITINGKKSSLPNFQKDIDAITQDWEETDYTDTSTSYLFKDNSQAFMKALEKEYIKTHISKANDGSTLLPPAPPAPKSGQDLPPPPPPPSVEDHLFKMNRLGGVFYYENKKVTYKKTLSIVKSNTDLNIKTPFPYGNTPKTFISRPENLQEAKLKKEEAQELQKKYVSQEPVTKEEIAIYNRLAKKYNTYNGGEIKHGEVVRMYDIYSRMTAKQKKRAESYPVLPPPPPPPPAPEPKKASKSGTNPPPPPAPAPATAPNKKKKFVYTNKEKEETDRFNEDEIEIIEVEEVAEEVEIDINNLIKQGATFYLNDQKISTSKARILVKSSKTLATINVSNSPNKKPIVHMTTK